jgi:undecaprenyl-diphosphatase
VEAAGLAVAVGALVFHKAKRFFCRRRPMDIEPHCWAHIVTKDKFSFPSGHSTTAFAVAVTLGCCYPEIRPVLMALAANVAVSRVVIGMHFVTDVLVGSGMGSILGYLAFRIVV